jgi:ketosteroid isomerase-like protein
MSTTQMSTMEIANTLVEMCRMGKNHDAIAQLYADDVVSVEASSPSPDVSPISNGREAVLAKGQWWVENHDIHDAQVTGPWPHGDQFIVGHKYDVTFKPAGKRFVMEEAALYTVKDGKIVHEAFFYSM